MAKSLEKISVGISVFAIVISTVSLWVAYEAYDIQKRTFDREATPLWKFSVDKEKGRIKIDTSSTDVHFDQAKVHFPNDLSGFYNPEGVVLSFPLDPFSGTFLAGPPNNEIDLDFISSALEKLCLSESEACIRKDGLKSPDPGWFQPDSGTLLGRGLPMCLDITYTYRLERKRAIGLYMLPFWVWKYPKERVTFDYPQLLRYLDASEDVQTVLNGEISESKRYSNY